MKENHAENHAERRAENRSKNHIEKSTKTSIDSISEYVDGLISSACLFDASDIHIDPKSDNVEVKLRIAGQISPHDIYNKVHHDELVGRIKVLSKLRTDVHDRNQDGRFYFDYIYLDKVSGKTSDITPDRPHELERVDLRVSILPTFFGENIVIRVLRPEMQRDAQLMDLGLTSAQATIVLESINREQGIIVIAGPTGSGKTTTIYTILSILSKKDKNIVTLEDPIEYVIPGIRQVQISEPADFGFGKALRALLRQDPDIIIIGEIRDGDTAELAFQASLTGHLVITTIHAEDCAGVYARLLNLGVSKDMMHSLSLMISQRLVQAPSKPNKRIGVFEVIPITGKAKVTLFQNTYPEYIRKALQKQGVMLLEDSMRQVEVEGTQNPLPTLLPKSTPTTPPTP